MRIGSVLPNDNPKVKNSNRFYSTWCSHEDIAGLIDACIKSKNVEYDIFYGVSDNDWKIWDISNAEKILSFKPSSNSEAYR